MLSIYSQRGEEYERKAKDLLFGVANSRKAYYYGPGRAAGCRHHGQEDRRRKRRCSQAVAKNPKLKHLASAWDTIAKIQKVRAANAKRYNMLEGGQGFNSSLFGFARTLVRAAEELPKPNEKRLQEFGDSGLASLKLKLFSKRPLYNDFEIAKLADSLGWLCEQLGYDDPLVQKVLAGKTAQVRAFELISGTKLFDVRLPQEALRRRRRRPSPPPRIR